MLAGPEEGFVVEEAVLGAGLGYGFDVRQDLRQLINIRIIVGRHVLVPDWIDHGTRREVFGTILPVCMPILKNIPVK